MIANPCSNRPALRLDGFGTLCWLCCLTHLAAGGPPSPQPEPARPLGVACPALEDNWIPPKSLGDVAVQLSDLEKELVAGSMGGLDLEEYLEAHRECQAAARLLYESSLEGRFDVATVFLERDQAIMEHMGLTVDSSEWHRLKRDGSREDAPALAKSMTRAWRVLSADVRNWIAMELRQTNILSMRSCRADYRSPVRETSIPVYWDHEPSGWMLCVTPGPIETFRVFFAMRNGERGIATNQFRVTLPQHLGDVRYERVVYAFRWCKPLAPVLERLRRQAAGCPRWVIPAGLPRFGSSKPHPVAGALQRSSGPLPVGLGVALLALAVWVGFGLGMLVCRRRKPRGRVA